MKKINLIAVLLVLCFACGNGDDIADQNRFEDFSGEIDNKLLTIKTSDGREVNAYLSKPPGTTIDIVLALHGGSATRSQSINSTLTYITKPDGGKQFLDNGFAVLCLEYTEFENDLVKSDRGFKELIDVLSATDYILNDSLAKHNVNVERVFAFGHSRGGANALLAGIERPLDGVIGAEPPLDWVKTRDSIQAGVISGDPNQIDDLIDKFEESITNWTEEDFIKYSPGLRLEEFQSPFMVISGEQDPAVLISIAEGVREEYLECNKNDQCIDGGEFVFHPLGHTDWSDSTNPNTLQAILNFIN